MKKLLLAFLMLITCFGMTSCNAFFAEEEAIVITSISKEIGKNSKGEDGFFIIIEYGNEDRLPDKFFVPNGKQGETGLEGNGIKEIKTSVDEKTKETTVTIIFTDEKVKPVSYKVPLGISLKGVVSELQPDGSSKVQFEFSDGSKSEPITLPKGPKGDGFESYEIKENEDGSKELVLTFTNHEPITIKIPAPVPGRGIQEIIYAYKDGDELVLEAHYTDGSSEEIRIERPNIWLRGDGKPGGYLGLVGDFYFDKRNKVIYEKVDELLWNEVVKLESSVKQTFKVKFEVNASDATLGQDSEIFVKEGAYFGRDGLNSLPVPTRPNYDFDGWYLVSTPGPINGRFTDTTPVLADTVLYAKWVASSKQ